MTETPRISLSGRLFFESKHPAAPGAPRMLLVTYSFPPDPSVGSLRWQELARFLIDAGWAVDVIARDFANVPHPDVERLERLPQHVRIFTVPDREPLLTRVTDAIWPLVRALIPKRPQAMDSLTQDEIFEQGGLRNVVRSYHVLAEAARDDIWAKAAASIGAELTSTVGYTMVASSGPPHMAHDAGRMIAMRAGLPHIVDMRDPWSFVQRLGEQIASPTWVHRARVREQLAMQNAKLVIMNTDAACGVMRAAYPEFASKITVVRNGSDDEPLPAPYRDECFRVRFAGNIYYDRDPRVFFRAVARVVKELALTPRDFMVELVGVAHTYAGLPTTLIAEQEGVGEHVRVSGRLSRQKAMEFLAGASVLLSLPQDSDFAVPAKIYEYVRFPAWMLVLTTPGSATADILRGLDADVVNPIDIDAIARVLRYRFEQFRAGVRAQPADRQHRLARRVQAEKLLRLVEDIRQQQPDLR